MIQEQLKIISSNPEVLVRLIKELVVSRNKEWIHFDWTRFLGRGEEFSLREPDNFFIKKIVIVEWWKWLIFNRLVHY